MTGLSLLMARFRRAFREQTSPRHAAWLGRLYGADAARRGQSCPLALGLALDRAHWRRQAEEVRRAFAFAFRQGYAAAAPGALYRLYDRTGDA